MNELTSQEDKLHQYRGSVSPVRLQVEKRWRKRTGLFLEGKDAYFLPVLRPLSLDWFTLLMIQDLRIWVLAWNCSPGFSRLPGTREQIMDFLNLYDHMSKSCMLNIMYVVLIRHYASLYVYSIDFSVFTRLDNCTTTEITHLLFTFSHHSEFFS